MWLPALCWPVIVDDRFPLEEHHDANIICRKTSLAAAPVVGAGTRSGLVVPAPERRLAVVVCAWPAEDHQLCRRTAAYRRSFARRPRLHTGLRDFCRGAVSGLDRAGHP